MVKYWLKINQYSIKSWTKKGLYAKRDCKPLYNLYPTLVYLLIVSTILDMQNNKTTNHWYSDKTENPCGLVDSWSSLFLKHF